MFRNQILLTTNVPGSLKWICLFQPHKYPLRSQSRAGLLSYVGSSSATTAQQHQQAGGGGGGRLQSPSRRQHHHHSLQDLHGASAGGGKRSSLQHIQTALGATTSSSTSAIPGSHPAVSAPRGDSPPPFASVGSDQPSRLTRSGAVLRRSTRSSKGTYHRYCVKLGNWYHLGNIHCVNSKLPFTFLRK